MYHHVHQYDVIKCSINYADKLFFIYLSESVPPTDNKEWIGF